MQETIPGVNPALVDALEERYPDRANTDPSKDPADVWMHAGAVRLIRVLRAQLARDLQEVL